MIWRNKASVLKAQTIPNCVFDAVHDLLAEFPGWRHEKPLRVERADLETEKHRLHWQTAVLGRHSHVCRVIARNFLSSRTHDDCNHEWEIVNKVNGEHEDRSLASLLTPLHRIEIDELNFAAPYIH
jgi:hypothetical protein